MYAVARCYLWYVQANSITVVADVLIAVVESDVLHDWHILLLEAKYISTVSNDLVFALNTTCYFHYQINFVLSNPLFVLNHNYNLV